MSATCQGDICKETQENTALVNVKSLHHDEHLRCEYNQQLQNLLQDVPSPEVKMDELERKIVGAINKASGVLPKKEKEKDTKPWVNSAFLNLLESRRKSKNKTERDDISKQIRIKRIELKNKYVREKANKTNVASKQRNTKNMQQELAK